MFVVVKVCPKCGSHRVLISQDPAHEGEYVCIDCGEYTPFDEMDSSYVDRGYTI